MIFLGGKFSHSVKNVLTKDLHFLSFTNREKKKKNYLNFPKIFLRYERMLTIFYFHIFEYHQIWLNLLYITKLTPKKYSLGGILYRVRPCYERITVQASRALHCVTTEVINGFKKKSFPSKDLICLHQAL